MKPEERAESQRKGREERGFVQCVSCKHYFITSYMVIGACLVQKSNKRYGFAWRKCDLWEKK